MTFKTYFVYGILLIACVQLYRVLRGLRVTHSGNGSPTVPIDSDVDLRNKSLSNWSDHPDNEFAMSRPMAHDPSKTKPIVILHVGCHKTSSTTTQKFLFEHTETLLRDNFRFPTNLPGRSHKHKNVANLARCVGETVNNCNRTMRVFDEFVTECKDQGYNIVLSSEAFTRQPDTRRIGHLLDGFEVHVVIFYRRLYEYLPSVFNQVNKHVSVTGQESVRDFFRLDRLPQNMILYTHNVYRIYRDSHLGTPSIVNMHDGSQNPLEDFVCNHMDDRAGNTCAVLRSDSKIATTVLNPRRSLQEGVVVRAAVAAGHLKNWDTLSKKQQSQVLRRVGRYLNARQNDVPMACVDDAVAQKILDLSIQYERELVPLWHDENALRRDFETKKKSSFCEPDGEQILKQLSEKDRIEMFSV